MRSSPLKNPDRRRWLGAAGCAAALSAAGALGSRTAAAADRARASGSSRVLVLYFTWAGSAKTVAEEIHRLLGGDIARLEPQEPYPAEYRATVDRAKVERESGLRPALKSGLPDAARYDVIVIGHPIWSGDMPQAVLGFVESQDWRGKTVAHFTTHGGSGLGRSHDTLRRLQPGARLTEPLAVYGWGGVRDLSSASKSLRHIGLLR